VGVKAGDLVAGKDYPRSFPQLQSWFADDDACRAYLEKLRWPDGFVCPACASKRKWRIGTGAWMCGDCGRKTTVTAGTIFDRTRSPLSVWFAAVWFVCAQKNGVSALGLQRVLGLGSYETAWAWMHKLRRAMVRPDHDLLDGLVEVERVSAFLCKSVTGVHGFRSAGAGRGT
jgi:transposase-like zinc ribbon protein